MADYNEAIKNLQTVHGMPMTIRLAIEALDRRIPKTPKIFKEKYMQPDYLCPTCDADVDHEWDCCAGCGQALNWEGVFE